MLRRILIATLLTVVVSFYLFPFSFMFLPHAINSKILVAVFGIMAFIYDGINRGGAQVSQMTVTAGTLAAIFSVWCLFSVTRTNTYNYIYATYLFSFLTWMAGAYGVYAALRLRYGEVTLPLMTRYLVVVCVAQCAMAVIMDNYHSVRDLVDVYVDQKQDFLQRGNRLYGIGAALDPTGIRFSSVLVLLSHQVATNDRLRINRPYIITALIGFTIIMVFGSVISRTTLVGAALGLVYMLFALFKVRRGGFITIRMIQTFVRFIVVVLVIIFVTRLLYEKNEAFRNYFRFGFEAFFNWIETGKFHTTSTDTLNERMWIWPTDPMGWIVGEGTFGIFENGTDIGYCNFILYCGLIGLSPFSVFFIYCHLSLNRKFSNFQICSLLLIILTFTVWIKVTTDIFYLDALLFCIASDGYQAEEQTDISTITTP